MFPDNIVKSGFLAFLLFREGQQLRFDILSNVFCCCNLAICFYCQAINAVVLGGVCAGSQDSPEPVWWKNSSTRELQGEREKDCLQLRWINSLIVLIGAVALALCQHEGKDGAGEERELTKEGTIAAFNGAATLKC